MFVFPVCICRSRVSQYSQHRVGISSAEEQHQLHLGHRGLRGSEPVAKCLRLPEAPKLFLHICEDLHWDDGCAR